MDEGLAFLAKRNVLRVTEADGLDIDRVGRFIERELGAVRQENAAYERARRRHGRP